MKICRYLLGVIWGIVSLILLYSIFISNDGFVEMYKYDFFSGFLTTLLLVVTISSAVVLTSDIDRTDAVAEILQRPENTKAIDLQKTKNKYIKTSIITIGAVIFLCGIITYQLTDQMYDSGYKQGKSDTYESAYDEGYNEGLDEGYDHGYDDGENATLSSVYTPETTEGYYIANTSDDVFVTPSGEKYHRSWCRYVSNRYDLRCFNEGAVAAEQAGYTPCSVCH